MAIQHRIKFCIDLIHGSMWVNSGKEKISVQIINNICTFIPHRLMYPMKRFFSKKITEIATKDRDVYDLCGNLVWGYGVKREVPVNKFYPPKRTKFRDSMFNIPNDADHYLRIVYGADYMSLPPIEDRKVHDFCLYVQDEG